MNRIGQQFGNYRLVRLLGQGGFAEVYLGEHVLMGSPAAIKILNTQLIPTDLQAFIQEARTLGNLEHPQIVRVKDCGVERGIPFLVMDYAPNGTLRQRHPKGTRVLLADVVSYVSQIAPALQYAHNLRLIHRDVKPENMLVGRNGEVLLSDFGIAVISSTSSAQQTKSSAGTTTYMSPEQILGKPRPASDQYALGIVVYEWLCGVTPFHGSLPELTAQHLHAPPPPFNEQGANIPPAVEAVVMKALAKSPEQRFASVQDFAIAFSYANPQQQTNRRTVDTQNDQSIFMSPPDRTSQFTRTPVSPQQPPLSPATAPVNPSRITPPLTPSGQPPVSAGVTPQAFTPPAQQPIYGPTPNVYPPIMPGQYLNPTVPMPTPVRRSKAGCVVAGVIGLIIVSALVIGLVAFGSQILSFLHGSTGSLQGNTPSTSFTQGVTPPPGQTPPVQTSPTQTPPVDVNGAASAMDAFCNDLNSGFIQGAYGLTSQNYQNQHSSTDFKNQFNNADLSQGGCLHNSPTVSNGVVTITFSFAKLNLTDGSSSTMNYTATLVQNSNGWVIDSIV